MAELLRFVIRTPHEVAFDERVRSARVPTGTGQVGLRPRAEPLLLVAEPGLVLLDPTGRARYAATAGGLLEGDREQAVLYTPFAVVGTRDEEVLDALDRELAAPGGELAARRQLDELEQRILQELRHRPRVRRTGEGA